MYRSVSPVSALLVALLLITFPAASARAQPSDLDAFMEKVLARRDVNRAALKQYILDESEAFAVLGPGGWPLRRIKREFTWYARDGMHVRSPLRFDGVPVDEAARRKYEEDWIRRDRARAERRAERRAAKPPSTTTSPSPPQTSGDADLQVGGSAEPRFVSEAYFMDFKFEPGNYYLAGREQLEGHEVLRIEHYPSNLFNESDDEKQPKEMKGKGDDAGGRDIDRKMNKTALVTLWVDPREHQIVKYTFDNVWLDFLPGAWLVRVDDIRASMTMGQPFAGVWLPRAITIKAGVTLAAGSFEASYDRAFSNYREAEVKTIIKVPTTEASLRPRPDRRVIRASAPGPTGVRVVRAVWTTTSLPRRVVHQQPVETVREIRVHGNASLTDEEVLALAGVSVGDPVTPALEDDVTRRLRASRRFETVDVRKRFRSLDDATDVALVLVVHERPGVVSASAGGTGGPPSPLRRITSRLMFLPIVSYADGYGLTYGGRTSIVDLLGAGERLSVPLTWGGTKRAALEVDRAFKRGPFTRLASSVEVWNRENPRYDLDEHRTQIKGRAERQFARLFRTGLDVSRSAVSFGPLDDRLWTLGADAALDTRGDPAFPVNAVVLGGGWIALHPRSRDTINRYTAEARGYLRVFRQNVLAGRMQYTAADAPLPLYERLLLGGASTLRGFRPGAFDGDRLAVASVEVRAPITAVVRSAKFGVTVFADAGKVADAGARLSDAAWRRGAGAGVFIVAPFVQLNLDVAHGAGAGTRLNVATGFSF